MSAATGELPLVNTILPYDYSTLVAYLTMLGLAEQVIPHMRAWCPWATAANYVMRMPPIIYWAFQARPFLLTEGSSEGNPGHDNKSRAPTICSGHLKRTVYLKLVEIS
ncbi:hypothetical protein DSO57_1036408 [Entomophthora muscae]|uniref:Uncharacterized protein n=2 Tax=Entomophthora muscae TaxID=34485 RepID=A0ACC2SBR7_9FUNG|nr:hypothetical protein DSO57_1038515 [Entomophthora muscae]KAJ9075404.1 hypothetical protein DSO57_1036408 [Entomophthora muscae]